MGPKVEPLGVIIVGAVVSVFTCLLHLFTAIPLALATALGLLLTFLVYGFALLFVWVLERWRQRLKRQKRERLTRKL